MKDHDLLVQYRSAIRLLNRFLNDACSRSDDLLILEINQWIIFLSSRIQSLNLKG